MVRARFAVLALATACGGDPAPATIDAAPPAHLVAYVSGYGPDLAWLDLDVATGALAPVGTAPARQAQPSFLAIGASTLYAVSESEGRVAAYALDPTTGAPTFLADVASGGAGPAHVAIDRGGRFVLAANYTSGTIAVLPIRGDGGVMAATQTLTAGANAHEIVVAPDGTAVFVPCKGADWIAQYTFDPATGALAPNPVPHLMTAAGAGPRHLAFAPDRAHAYLVNENDSTLVALAFDATTEQLATRQTVSTRAPGATGANTGAEVAVHPSGRWVYASNRGDDDLAQLAIDPADGTLTLVGHTPTGGATPRMFAIDPTGAWLFVANQGSDTVITFAIDPTTGALARVGAPLASTSPAFVGFASLPR